MIHFLKTHSPPRSLSLSLSHALSNFVFPSFKLFIFSFFLSVATTFYSPSSPFTLSFHVFLSFLKSLCLSKHVSLYVSSHLFFLSFFSKYSRKDSPWVMILRFPFVTMTVTTISCPETNTLKHVEICSQS